MIEVASAVDFLTNGVVEGELLADKMAAGPLSPEQALQYGVEIGKSLAAAHSRGLVYGCLSPDHVMVAADGAHLLHPEVGPGRSSARYRAPEQVRGEKADWRSDIFSFGILLYEMVAGHPAFSGPSAELDSSILHESPAPLNIKSPVYYVMEGVIGGCTEKDPSKRRQRIQNAVIELKLAVRPQAVGKMTFHRRPAMQPRVPDAARFQTPVTAIPPASAFLDLGPANANGNLRPGAKNKVGNYSWKRRLTIVALAALAMAASGAAAFLYLRQRQPVPVVKFSLAPPDHTSYPGTPSVSPDGTLLTFSAVGSDGRRMLWVRALDETHARVISGTEAGFAPFWSPDSEWIAFFANKELRKVHVKNGPNDPKPETVAAADREPGGGTWNKEGTILFAPAMNGGLYRVAANGGRVSPVLDLNPAKSERADLWPQFLPDGKHFIYFKQTELPETTGVYIGGPEPAESRQLFPSDTNAVYSPLAGAESSRTGYLLYMKERSARAGQVTADLMGQGFNAAKLVTEGDPIRLADDIGSIRTLSLAPISVSANAVLVYQTVGVPVRQLAWVDRTGQQIGTVGEASMWGPPRISPNGSQVAVGKLRADGINSDLWLFDSHGNPAEFVQTPNVSEGFPVWSPDGARIAYWSNAAGNQDLYVKPAAGGRAELLYQDGNNKFPVDWSKDGKFLLFDEESQGTRRDVRVLSMANKAPATILGTVKTEGYATLSPDGRWLAYQTDESGRYEVYVQPFEGVNGGTKRRWKVSANSGNGQSGLPRWRGDGKELFYMTTGGAVMSVTVRVNGSEIGFDPPKPLFQRRAAPKSWNLFDVSPDGERFLLNLPMEWSNSSVITVMTNWTEKLKT